MLRRLPRMLKSVQPASDSSAVFCSTPAPESWSACSHLERTGTVCPAEPSDRLAPSAAQQRRYDELARLAAVAENAVRTAERERTRAHCNARPSPGRDDDLRNRDRAGSEARGHPDGMCAWCCSAADAAHSGPLPPEWQSRDHARLLLPADKHLASQSRMTAFSPVGAAWDNPPVKLVTPSAHSPRLVSPRDAGRHEAEGPEAIQRQKDLEAIQRHYWGKSPYTPIELEKEWRRARDTREGGERWGGGRTRTHTHAHTEPQEPPEDRMEQPLQECS